MAQVLNGSGIEPLKASKGNNGATGMKSDSEDGPKTYQDILAYQDKWIGWDGPVWCSRYGRFENQEDASADDGYTIKGQPPHQNLGLERCEKHDCSCRVPFQHTSYVHDIQRRVEPMVSSLVKLEHQVGSLVHHLLPKGGEAPARETNGNETQPPGVGFAERYEGTIRHDPQNTSHADHTSNQHAMELMRENFRKLEARVEGLVHQMQGLMHHQDHHITEKVPDDSHGGK